MAQNTPERRSPLWVKILLAASLGLNLTIAGMVAGFVMRGGSAGAKGPAMGYAAPYVLALPREDRRVIFRAVRKNPNLPGRRERRETYQDMVALLRADSFDRTAVEDILARQAKNVGQIQISAQAAWLDAVAGMTALERQAYAEKVKDVVAQGRRGPRGKRD